MSELSQDAARKIVESLSREQTPANRGRFQVLEVTDKTPRHFAVWESTFGAVAGRFLDKAKAEALRDRLNAGETPDFTPRCAD